MIKWRRKLAFLCAVSMVAGNTLYVPAEEFTSEIEVESLFTDEEAVGESVNEELGEAVEAVGSPATEEETESLPIEELFGDELSEETVAFEEEEPAQAQDNVSGEWRYVLEDGKAYITGYSGSAANLEIPSKLNDHTIVGIKGGAFKNNDKLQSVKIPASITMIGDTTGAFENCINLVSVIMAEGTEKGVIGSYAFRNCSSLRSIEIPSNIHKIGYAAFKGCAMLQNLTITSSGSMEADQVIEGMAFEGCKALGTVYIPATVKSIGQSAFLECTSLTSVTLNEGLKSIGYAAFRGCTELQSITIPSTVTEIGSKVNMIGAFEDCSKLTTVTLREGAEASYIGMNSFKNCTLLERIIVPKNYKIIHYSAFKGCTALKEFKWASSGVGYADQLIENNAFAGCISLEKVFIPDSVETIEYEAFNGCSNLSELTLSEGIDTIESGAFKDCVKLTNVVIPATLTVLGSESNQIGVFQGCSSLGTVTIKKGLFPAFIGDNTFKDCKSLQNITIPGNYLRIHSNAFRGCINLKTLVYENSGATYTNQYIDSYAFAECASLTSVTLPETLDSIAEYAFAQNASLLEVSLAEGLKSLYYGVFLNCMKLETVNIPGTVTNIGSTSNTKGVFEGCSSLKKVNIAPNADGNKGFVLGQNTFKNCSSLTYVYIPESFGRFYVNAFQGVAEKFSVWGVEGSPIDTFTEANKIPFNQINIETPKIKKIINQDGAVKIYWNAADQALKYNVYRRILGEKSYTKVATTTKLAFTDSTVLSGVTYEYTLVGINGENRSDYLKDNASILYLAAPSNIKMTNKAGQVNVTWKAVNGAEYYIVYRKASGSGWKKTGVYTGTGKPLFVDQNVEEGKDYIYTVKACNGKTVSAYNKAGVEHTYLGTTSISKISNAANGISLKWKKMSGAQGYVIYRKTSKTAYVRVGKVIGEDNCSYVDETAVNGKGYTYAVRSYKGKINGTYQEAKMVRLNKTVITTAENKKAGTINLAWNLNDKVTGYQVKYISTTGDTKVVYAQNNSIVLKELDKDEVYKIYVRAYRTVANVKYYGSWSSKKTVEMTK